MITAPRERCPFARDSRVYRKETGTSTTTSGPARDTRCLISVACAIRVWRMGIRSSARRLNARRPLLRVSEAKPRERPLEKTAPRGGQRCAERRERSSCTPRKRLPKATSARSPVTAEARARRVFGAVLSVGVDRQRRRRSPIRGEPAGELVSSAAPCPKIQRMTLRGGKRSSNAAAVEVGGIDRRLASIVDQKDGDRLLAHSPSPRSIGPSAPVSL